MHYFQTIHDECKKATSFGEKRTRNGVNLYGHMRWAGPEAWFHHVFPPLADYELKLLQADLMIGVPENVADFFSLTNGLVLFSGSFAIYGRRTEASFDPDFRVPYDIVPVNRFERPAGMDSDMLIMGGYRWGNGGFVAVDTRTGRAVASTRKDARVLFEWPTFEDMLCSEVMRLANLFDGAGRPKNQTQSELPWDGVNS